jgi:hypothetical protein
MEAWTSLRGFLIHNVLWKCIYKQLISRLDTTAYVIEHGKKYHNNFVV